MPLTSLSPVSLQDQIEEHLVSFILTEERRPGARLPSERELATRLGVGRGSVRQALVALEVAGVVEIRPNSGVYVASGGLSRAYARPTGPDAVPPLDIVLARRMVEGEAAALAAGHARDAQLDRVAATITAFERAETRYDLRHPADRDFHLLIAEAGGNRAVERLVADLWEMQRGKLYLRLEDHFSTAPMRDLAIADHKAVMEALWGARPDPRPRRHARPSRPHPRQPLHQRALGAAAGRSRRPAPAGLRR